MSLRTEGSCSREVEVCVWMEAYTDAEYRGSVSGSRSTSDYCTFLCENIVAWRSKKQSVVARSSVEAEFKVVAQGICELL
jgi:hypothetical protein